MESHRPVDIARSDPELAFIEFVAFNGGHFAVFRASGAGAGPWEMHPDTDELLFALEGTVTIETYSASGYERVPLTGGSRIVVPRGRWHPHVDADNLVELHFTPGPSLHADDPASECRVGLVRRALAQLLGLAAALLRIDPALLCRLQRFRRAARRGWRRDGVGDQGRQAIAGDLTVAELRAAL